MTSLRVVGLCAVSTPPQANKEEKISLEEQERLIRAWCDEHGHTLVDMLIIPGFSRRFYNLYDLIDESAKKGHDAPRRLLEHIRARDFDLLVCRYGSRMAREQSLFGEIVARVIDTGAEIFTLADGRVHKGNYRMYTSMGGYAAATEVDRLVQGRKDAMRERAAKGLPTASVILMTHRLIKDERGRPLRLEIDPAQRRFLDDMAAVLLEGVSFKEMGNALYERYGHTGRGGRPFSAGTLYRLLYTPAFWGHSAQGLRGADNKVAYGVWAWDEVASVPEGITVHRHTHEAAYTGELAERVKSELRRRAALRAGRMNRIHANPFSGLLYCDACGYRLSYHHLQHWVGYHCISSNNMFRHFPRYTCDSRPRSIALEAVQDWFDTFLRKILHSADPLTFRFEADGTQNGTRAAALKVEIADCERRIAALLLQRADTPPASQGILTSLIQTEDTRLTALRNQLAASEQSAASAAGQRAAASASLDELAAAWQTGFWSLDADSINRLLFGILGDWRLWVRDGEIVDFKPLPR